MSNNPYDYENRAGVLPISWNDMHGLCKALAPAVASVGVELILPIGRAGFYAGTLLAHLLRLEVYPVRVSRRVQDTVVHEAPQWLLRPPTMVAGQRVLIVDEICSTGGTLEMVKAEVLAMGAAQVWSAVLYAHSWSTAIPDFIGLVSDALILNPWDRELWQDGAWVLHPEYVGAFNEQGLEMGAEHRIPTPEFTLAKGGGSPD